jgi:hypothetical protein
VVISAVLGVLAAKPVRAQNAEAETLFNEGNKLMADGVLARACDAFEASNRLEPRAGTLIHLGECRRQNDQLASAWSAYKDALTRVKDDHKRKLALRQVAALESRLSYLTISVPDEARIEGLTLTYNGKPFDPVLWNRPFPVDGGDYVVAAHAPQHEDWQTMAHIATELDKVIVEVPTLTVLHNVAVTPASTSGTSPDASPSPEAHRREPTTLSSSLTTSPSSLTTIRKLSIGLAGAGAISAIAGATLWTLARASKNDAFQLCPDIAKACSQAVQANRLLESSNSRMFDANVTLGITAAAMIGAGVLWLTGAPDTESSPRVSVVPTLAPGEAGVVFSGRF